MVKLPKLIPDEKQPIARMQLSISRREELDVLVCARESLPSVSADDTKDNKFRKIDRNGDLQETIRARRMGPMA